MKYKHSEPPVIMLSYQSKIKSIKVVKSSNIEITLYANDQHHKLEEENRQNLPEKLVEGKIYHNGKISGKRAIYMDSDTQNE